MLRRCNAYRCRKTELITQARANCPCNLIRFAEKSACAAYIEKRLVNGDLFDNRCERLENLFHERAVMQVVVVTACNEHGRRAQALCSNRRHRRTNSVTPSFVIA